LSDFGVSMVLFKQIANRKTKHAILFGGTAAT